MSEELRTASTSDVGSGSSDDLKQRAQLAGQVLEVLNRRPGQFVKGQSGNPKGRPRVDTLVRQAARLEGLKSIAVIVELRDTSRNEKIKLAAATALLDRGFGKPREAKPLDDEDALESGADVELDDESLSALLGESK